MQPNPFEAGPVSNTDQQNIAAIETIEWICVVPLVVLVVSCLYHYSLIENPQQYRNSMCIGAEVLALMMAMCCVPFHVIRAIIFCFQRRFRKALLSLLAAGLTFAVIGWAMWYDAPTLIYMT